MGYTMRSVVLLPFLAVLLGMAGPEGTRARLGQLETAMAAELEAHGQRTMGQDGMRWKTRLESFYDCRAQFTVHTSTHMTDTVDKLETLYVGLSGLEPAVMQADRRELDMPCSSQFQCVTVATRCTKTTKDGIAVDCTSLAEKRKDALVLEYDGDPAAAQRIFRLMSQAVEACRQPVSVAF
jgi:hypothetical protein